MCLRKIVRGRECLCVRVRACVCMCGCVCLRERVRERKRKVKVAASSCYNCQHAFCYGLPISSTRRREAPAQAEASCAAPELLLHGRQVSRVLHDHDRLQPRSDGRPPDRLLHSPVSAHQRTDEAHIRLLVSKVTAQKQIAQKNYSIVISAPRRC